MNAVHVPVDLKERSYDIAIAPGLFSCGESVSLLSPFVRGKKAFIVSDSNVFPLYGNFLRNVLFDAGASDVADAVFQAGEASKTFSVIEMICRKAVQSGLDRGSLIVGLGGGVTGDMAAFAASVFMRGVRCVQVPTTLLAMIDSGVGGKTGVNLPEGKNLIGTFYQPSAVLMDPDFLSTLPERELSNGCAELIKHAILFDGDLFGTLTEMGISLFQEKETLSSLIARSCGWKAAVVSRDEKEKGERMLLNLGHTFGHAIEKIQNYSSLEHGEAVAVGIAAAAHLSVNLGILSPDDLRKILFVLKQFRLPVVVSGCTPEMLYTAMRSDKKAVSGMIRWILPHAIGACEVHTDLPEEMVYRACEAICE